MVDASSWDITQEDAKEPLLMLQKRLKKRVLLKRQVEGSQEKKLYRVI